LPVSDTDCPVCGERLPADADRFCPHCGAPLDTGTTFVDEPPPHETGPVPVSHVQLEPRFFGVTPVGALVAVGVAAVGVGIALLVLDESLAGAVILVLGLLALVGAIDRRRRREALRAMAARAGYLGTALTAHAAGRRRMGALRRELDALSRRREEQLRALGEAVYGEDDAATDPLREELTDLDRRIAEKREETDRVMSQVEEQIRRARLETSATQVVPPEPYPPPDEGDVPDPARVPEPYPPPDEGDPPEQPRVPEPYPEPPDEPTPGGPERQGS
jgi:hypothetical protein